MKARGFRLLQCYVLTRPLADNQHENFCETVERQLGGYEALIQILGSAAAAIGRRRRSLHDWIVALTQLLRRA